MLSKNGHQLLFNYVENYPKPVIAAVNGFALGGGFELALSCHIRVASDNAKMGFPEVTLGVIPGYGGTQRLAQLAGRGKAFELILTADMIKAEEALQLGLLNAVVPQSELMSKVNEIAEKIKSKSPAAISHAIVAINANYTDGLSIEIQINPEFKNVAEAEIQALKYAEVFGKLPTALRSDVKTSWIHKGTESFGGGNNNLLIYIGQSLEYENDGILEETLVHEAAHSSLDEYHSASSGWINAQKLDPSFISTYARDNPKREDVAETYLLYMALRYRSDRISSTLKETILQTIPNRIKYFDAQNFKMQPIK